MIRNNKKIICFEVGRDLRKKWTKKKSCSHTFYCEVCGAPGCSFVVSALSSVHFTIPKYCPFTPMSIKAKWKEL